jgi:uncharacterized protein (DUF305 family)
MHTRIGPMLVALALTVVLAAAKTFTPTDIVASCQPTAAGGMPAQGTGTPEADRAAFVAASMACMATMQDSMRAALMAPVGGPDAVFAAAMSAHHEGAIGMAQSELRYGHDPELRRMAQEMVAAQGREVRQMRLARVRLLSSNTARVHQGP